MPILCGVVFAVFGFALIFNFRGIADRMVENHLGVMSQEREYGRKVVRSMGRLMSCAGVVMVAFGSLVLYLRGE